MTVAGSGGTTGTSDVQRLGESRGDMDTAPGRLRKRLRAGRLAPLLGKAPPLRLRRAAVPLFRRQPGPRRSPAMSQHLGDEPDAAVQLDEVGPVARHHFAGGDPHHDVE